MTTFNKAPEGMAVHAKRVGVEWPSLQETVEPMITGDYKDRFVAEYWQTKIRYERLKKFNTKIRAAQMQRNYTGLNPDWEPKHDCPEYLLEEQQRVMGEYLKILETRAEIEGIEL